jgi:hypothetical protein
MTVDRKTIGKKIKGGTFHPKCLGTSDVDGYFTEIDMSVMFL